MAKKKLMFTDEAGNRLYVQFIKSRGVYQWSAKNARQKLVEAKEVRKLMQTALRKNGQEYLASKLPPAIGWKPKKANPSKLTMVE